MNSLTQFEYGGIEIQPQEKACLVGLQTFRLLADGGKFENTLRYIASETK